MNSLYPPVEPFAVHQLDVGDGHHVYVEEVGNPEGLPVVFLHGGPGSGCNINHRRYFDGNIYRVILFDQRGSNRSRPMGEIRANTTGLLIDDLEQIRRHLGIGRWVVFGGSWGATLALLYAQAFPGQVLGLVLRGTFLARDRDLRWFGTDGVRRLFPDEWERFVDAVAPAPDQDPLEACARTVLGADDQAGRRCALAWSGWAGVVATYLLPADVVDEEPEATVVAKARIEMHYAANRYFIAENQILDRIGSVPRVPTRIIHGRRDLTCTLDASWALHRALPGSDLVIVREGGHLASEPVMTDALVDATRWMAGRLS